MSASWRGARSTSPLPRTVALARSATSRPRSARPEPDESSDTSCAVPLALTAPLPCSVRRSDSCLASASLRLPLPCRFAVAVWVTRRPRSTWPEPAASTATSRTSPLAVTAPLPRAVIRTTSWWRSERSRAADPLTVHAVTAGPESWTTRSSGWRQSIAWPHSAVSHASWPSRRRTCSTMSASPVTLALGDGPGLKCTCAGILIMTASLPDQARSAVRRSREPVLFAPGSGVQLRDAPAQEVLTQERPVQGRSPPSTQSCAEASAVMTPHSPATLSDTIAIRPSRPLITHPSDL